MSPWPFLVAVVVFVFGLGTGIRYEEGQAARRELARQTAENEARARVQPIAARAAQAQAQRIETLNTDLLNAYAQIDHLQARACLDPRTVGLLNGTGHVRPRPTASEPASAPAAAASAGSDAAPAGGLKWASNIDVGRYIAYCRSEYAKIAGQLNEVLDVEDARFPPGGASPGTGR